jgi:hypothetical protein
MNRKVETMNPTIERTSLCALLLLAVSALQCANTKTIGRPPLPKPDFVVAQDGSTDYETIGDALDEAEAGAVILVKPGVYQETIEIEADEGPLTIVGQDPATTILDADGEYAAITLKSSGNHISGLTVKGGESHGIYIPGGNQKIDYCLIIDNGDRGVYISTMSGGGSAQIDHCTIAGNKVSSVYCANREDKTTITNSILTNDNRNLAWDGDGLNLVVNNSCLFSTDAGSDVVVSGSNNIRKDPRYKDPENGDYRLKPGSPCLKTASDGSNMGCF